MDYQTYRPMTNPLKTRKTFTRNNFADHNYNYVNPSQTTHPPRESTQNHIFSQKSKFSITSTNSVNFHDYSHSSHDQIESYPFFQQKRNKQQTPYYKKYLSSDNDDYYQPDIFAPYTQEYRAQKTSTNSCISKHKNLPTKSS